MSQSQVGKVIVITGGNSGMGYATAKLFASEGAEVFITGRDEKTLKTALQELGPKAKGAVSNAGSVAEISKLAETLKKEYKRIDTLFLNAGVGEFASLEAGTEEQFDKMFNINVKGPYFLLQKVLPLLGKGSSVVFNGSTAAHSGFPDFSIYSATKAAVVNLVKTLTTELTPKGIRINVLSPGPIDTPIFGRLGGSEAEVKAMKDQFASGIPLGRMGDPQDIARAVLFLGSEASSFVAGTELIIDGGMTRR